MRRLLAGLGIVAILSGAGMATAEAVSAPKVAAVRCGGPCPTTTLATTTTKATYVTTTAPSTTIATTTTKAQETTTTAASTTIATTTTANRGFCTPDPAFPNKVCLNISETTTTVPATTVPIVTTVATTVAPTTSPPETSAVDQTVPEAPTTTIAQELPHTGSMTLPLVLAGLGALALGAGALVPSLRRKA